MMKSILGFAILSLSLNVIAQDSSNTIILYTKSPYFGPTDCEKTIQEKYGITYSASSNLTDRQFKKKNEQARKELALIHGEAWYEKYLNEVKECTEPNKK